MRAVLGACGPRQRSVNGPLVYRETVSGGWAVFADEVLDQLDLVVLVLGAEALERLGDGHVLAHERLVGADVLAHAVLDALEVGVGGRGAVGEVEVVVEAVLDRRSDRDLHARIELEHRGGQHVGGVVADEVQRVLAAARRDDLRAPAVGQRAVEVVHHAADLDRQRRAGQARPDRGRDVGAGRAVGQLDLRAVGELERHLARC